MYCSNLQIINRVMTKLTNSYNFEMSSGAKITKVRENFEKHKFCTLMYTEGYALVLY